MKTNREAPQTSSKKTAIAETGSAETFSAETFSAETFSAETGSNRPDSRISELDRAAGFEIGQDFTRFDQINDVFSRAFWDCLLYTSPSPRDGLLSRMPSSA